jgi:hypothetical protein
MGTRRVERLKRTAFSEPVARGIDANSSVTGGKLALVTGGRFPLAGAKLTVVDLVREVDTELLVGFPLAGAKLTVVGVPGYP